jgi:hypothetical protein
MLRLKDREWMDGYEDEYQKIEILTQTKMKIESYKQRGMNFFTKFFKNHHRED